MEWGTSSELTAHPRISGSYIQARFDKPEPFSSFGAF
jgi:hypothetical protein